MRDFPPAPMDQVISTLESLGLSRKECDMYITLLQVGTSLSSTLARRTKLSRSTAQYTCDQLVKKGIVRAAQKGNTRIFTPEAPEKLLLLLERQRNEIEKKEKRVSHIIGDLKGIMNPHGVLPKAQFFEGSDGMMELYDQILDMRAPIDSFEEKGNLTVMFPEYAKEFAQKRVERKIPNRCICPVGSPMNASDPSRFIEVRFVDPEKYPFTWHVKICKDLVGIFSFEERAAVGVSIRHADIAKNFQMLFDLVWDALEPDAQRGR